MKQKPIVCAYYFPNWHVDPRNEKYHGKNWTEWQVVKHATPRFEGHDQPKVPLWGYEDEASPTVMAKKIKAASEHSINAFIFDWYFFEDGPYRERCLNNGFLKAKNCKDIKFGLMWANHDHIYSHPGSYKNPAESVWSGSVTPETFIKCTDYCIEHYFKEPNYLRIEDGLYFSIFNTEKMVNDLGGPNEAGLLFRNFRDRVEKAGLGKVTLDARCNSLGGWRDFHAANRLIKKLGVDMCSNYNWAHYEGFPAMDYASWFENNMNDFSLLTKSLCIPYNPVVMQGWDSSPRTVQSDMYEKVGYPFSTIIKSNTPELFEQALSFAHEFMMSPDATGSMVHVACWNEWTEGSYLEPDTKYGYGYLEAIKRVFG